MPDIDTSLLRTFVSLAETRSFTRTAERINRSQATVSTQIQKLEEVLGRELFERDRRNVRLSPDGETLLGYARQMVELAEAMLGRFREPEVEGEIRFGSPEDHATFYLPDILAEFTHVHPRVRLDVNCELTLRLIQGFEQGRFDLIIIKQEPDRRHSGAQPLWREKLVWVGSAEFSARQRFESVVRQLRHGHLPLPLVLSPSPCVYRQRALEALDRAGIPWKITYTSPSLAGATAAVRAGLGLTVLPRQMVPESLVPFEASAHWPHLKDSEICLLAADSAPPATDELARFIRQRIAPNQ
jgi:DNA-binding transcriptional LysR family regulator